MPEWFMEGLPSFALIVVAVIEAISLRDRKKAKEEQERVERRAQIRERESRLSMEMMAATCALALVTAKKVNGMHTNGDVEEAMEKAKEAQSGYQSFLEDTAARQIGKP